MLLRVARSRLALVTFIYAGAYLVLQVAGRLTDTFHIATQFGPFRIVDIIATVCVLGSILFGLFIRNATIDPERLVDLALVYEFIAAVGMESYLLLWPPELPIESPTISWAHLWVVVFPLLVPARPTKAMLTATLCVLLYPAFLFALRQRGGILPDGAEIFASIAGLVSVVIATLAARTIYGLGKDVTRARRLGSYQLVEPLGEGGMGQVWRAEHRMLARPAAIVAHVNSKPDPPSRHGELSVPRDLERVILRCLEKDPGARPQSADELRDLLLSSGTGSWSREDGRRWWHVHVPDRV